MVCSLMRRSVRRLGRRRPLARTVEICRLVAPKRIRCSPSWVMRNTYDDVRAVTVKSAATLNLGRQIISAHGMPCPYRCKNKIKGWRSEDRRYKFKSNIKIPTRESRIYLGGAGGGFGFRFDGEAGCAIGAEPATELVGAGADAARDAALGHKTFTAMPGRRSEMPAPVSWARTS